MNDFRELIQDETLRSDPELQQYKTIDDLIKTHKNAQSMLGSRIPIPQQDSAQEVLDEFYKKIGRPEDPDKYDYQFPTVKSFKPEEWSAFKKAAFSAGLNQTQAKKLFDEVTGFVTSKESAIDQEYQAKVDEVEAWYAKNYGEKAPEIKASNEKFLKEKFGEKAFEHFKRTGVHTMPDVAEAIQTLIKATGEDPGVSKSAGRVDPNANIAALKEEYNSFLLGKHHKYGASAIDRYAAPSDPGKVRFQELQKILFS